MLKGALVYGRGIRRAKWTPLAADDPTEYSQNAADFTDLPHHNQQKPQSQNDQNPWLWSMGVWGMCKGVLVYGRGIRTVKWTALAADDPPTEYRQNAADFTDLPHHNQKKPQSQNVWERGF